MTTKDVDVIHRVKNNIANILSTTDVIPRVTFSVEQLEYLHRVFPEAMCNTDSTKLDMIRGQRSVVLHIASLIKKEGML